MNEIIAASLVLAGVVAVAIAVIVRSGRTQDGGAAEIRAATYEQRIRELQTELSSVRQDLLRAEGERAAAMARVEEARRGSEEQAHLIKAAEDQLRDTFKVIAGEVLSDNRKELLSSGDRLIEDLRQRSASELDSRKSAITDLIAPLKDALESYRSTAEQLERMRQEQLGKIHQQYEQLSAVAAGLQVETSKLVNALRSPQIRGRWGQITLRRAAELVGMVDHCDFYEQETAPASRLRPDMLVKLPGRRLVVVDAKVPLDGYLDALDRTEGTEREEALLRHARQTREHIKALAQKEYQEQFEEAPDFVVAFIPSDSVLAAAVEKDPALVEYALSQSVVIATPSTLFVLLRVIAHSWRREMIATQAEVVRQLGSRLSERLDVFIGHFEKLGGAIRRTVDVYNETVGSFTSRVLPSARRFKELGVTTRDFVELPEVDVVPRSALPAVTPEGAVEMFPEDDPMSASPSDEQQAWLVGPQLGDTTFTCGCRVCGKTFEASGPNARYCSTACRLTGRPVGTDVQVQAGDNDEETFP